MKESLWTIVLTDKALYKMLPTGEVRRRMDLLEIHSIDVDRTDSNAFWMFSCVFFPFVFGFSRITSLTYSDKSSTALQADKVKGEAFAICVQSATFGFGIRSSRLWHEF